MNNYKSIISKINKISLENNYKTFSFLIKLFENEFKVELINEFYKLELVEQYLVCYFFRLYFSEDSEYLKTLIVKDFETKSNENDFIVSFQSYYKTLSDNRKQIEIELDSFRPTAERRFKTKIENKYSDNINNLKAFNYRVDIFEKSDNFKDDYKNSFKLEIDILFRDIMSENDRTNFFYNSFFYNESFPTLLNIEIESKKVLHQKIMKPKRIFIERFSNDSIKNRVQNKGTAETIQRRQIAKAINRPLQKSRKVKLPTNNDFVKIMFNSFPVYRDNYVTEYLSKGKKLETFLKNVSKNIGRE